MGDMLRTQEGMDRRLDQWDEELRQLRQLRSQSQADGGQLAALSLQLQELISSVESVRICVVSILRFFVIDPFMIVFPTVFISYLSDDLSFIQIRSLSLMY